MPQDLRVLDRSLGTEFWYTDDLRLLEKQLRGLEADGPGANRGLVKLAALKRVTSRDPVIFSLAAGGAKTPRTDQILNEARLFGQRVNNVNDPPVVDDLATLGLAHLDEEIVRLFRAQLPQDDPARNDEHAVETARAMLKAMLRHPDFARKWVGVADRTQSFAAAGAKAALVNATLGALMLHKEGRLTLDSLLVLTQNRVYDLAHGESVLRLTHETAAKVYDDFVNARDLTDGIASKFNDDNPMSEETREGLQSMLAQIKNLRRQMMRSYAQILNRQVDMSDAKSVDRHISDLANAMRSFRYKLDKRTGETDRDYGEKGTMTGIRRGLDDFFSSNVFHYHGEHPAGSGRTIDLLMCETNLLARQGLEEFSLRSPNNLRRFTDLSHLANDRVRQYFSGHERSLDTFADRARELYSELAAGDGSRSITTGVKISAKLGYGADKPVEGVATDPKVQYASDTRIEAGIKGARTQELSVSWGQLSKKTSTDVNLFAELDFDRKVADTEVKVNAGAGIGGGMKAQRDYASVEDFIAESKGSSELVQGGTLNKIPFLLGKIAYGICRFGALVKRGLVRLGFLHDNFTRDNLAYQCKLVERGVIRAADRVLANRRAPALLTRDSSAWHVGGEVHAEAKFQISDQVNLGGGASVDGDRTARGVGSIYISAVDEALQAPRDFLRELSGDDWEPPTDVAGCRRVFDESLKALLDFERMASTLRRGDGWQDDYRNYYRRLVARFAYAAELWESLALDADDVVDEQTHCREAVKTVSVRLARPEIDIGEEDFRRIFQHRIFAAESGAITSTQSLSVNWDVNPWAKSGDESESSSATERLKEAGTDLAVEAGRTFSGLSGTVQVSHSVTKMPGANDSDPRPWVRGTRHDFCVKLPADMPLRLVSDILVKAISKKDEEAGQSFGRRLKDFFKEFGVRLGHDFANTAYGTGNKAITDYSLAELGNLARDGKHPSLAKFLSHDENDFGLDLGTTNESAIVWTVHSEYGHFTSLGIANSTTTESKLGVGVNLGAFGIGVGVNNSITDTRGQFFEIFQAPPQTLLGLADLCENQSTGVEGMKLILAGCRKATLDLYDAYNRPRDEIGDQLKREIAEAMAVLQMVKADEMIENMTRQRATKLQAQINQMVHKGWVLTHFNPEEDPNETEIRKLDFMAELFIYLTRAFRLAKEAGQQHLGS